MGKFFFSFVVPAHNEAKCIENTLEHLKTQHYPADKFEVIVVENGSGDDTFARAKRFESESFRILQSAKGTSKAKNCGIDRLSPESDWVIFLDADTVPEPGFLNQLDAFLAGKDGYTVGTVSLRPLPDTLKSRVWFWMYNLGHLLTKTSFSIKIVKRSLFPRIRFDETITMGEDLLVIAQARAHGKFFFMWTRNMFTSTRRFDKLGWLYISFYWIYVALLSDKKKKEFQYDVIR